MSDELENSLPLKTRKKVNLIKFVSVLVLCILFASSFLYFKLNSNYSSQVQSEYIPILQNDWEILEETHIVYLQSDVNHSLSREEIEEIDNFASIDKNASFAFSQKILPRELELREIIHRANNLQDWIRRDISEFRFSEPSFIQSTIKITPEPGTHTSMFSMGRFFIFISFNCFESIQDSLRLRNRYLSKRVNHRRDSTNFNQNVVSAHSYLRPIRPARTSFATSGIMSISYHLNFNISSIPPPFLEQHT